jgi:hypothetical protein
MESFQKRNRERRKLQKRKDKQDRMKERAEVKHQDAPGSEPVQAPSDTAQALAGDGPATEPRPEGPLT